MKNVHALPTDKPSRIYLIKSNNKLGITSNNPEFTENFGSGTQNQNIYITSDEEIKEGDWCLDLMNNTIYVATKVVVHNLKSLEYEEYLKKIILTTDQDLIADGVQAIDDEFLEWFVKNPSCEEVEVGKIEDELISPKNQKIRFNALQDPPSFISAESLNNMILTYKYKIIIPKEEPKQEKFEHIPYKGNVWEPPVQETLEEFAEKEAIKQYLENTFGNIIVRKSIEKGAKWQQERSYSEEEVYHILCEHTAELFKGSKMTLTEWFEQYKKK